jgi:hypothetical protein
MGDRNFENCIPGELEEVGLAVPPLENEGQEVEGGARATWPSQGSCEVGERRLGRIPKDRAVRLAVTRIADELVVPDADARTPCFLLGEDADRRHDVPVIGGEAQVLDEGGEDLLGGFETATVAYGKAGPVLAADATDAIAPRELRPMRELLD